MIQDRPICFDCEKQIDYDPVFASPWHERADFPSAVFHGICLMSWRERRAEVRRVIERHMRGQCSCQQEE